MSKSIEMTFSVKECVLWCDEALLVVDKPAGLPTVVDGYDPKTPYLLSLLKEVYAPLWVVHRLDRDTSGAIVFARTAEAHRALNTQFEKRLASKTYHALVVGSPEWEEKLVKLPLRADGDRRHRTVVDQRGGKPAATQLRLLERFGRFSLVEATPLSGRTHQIRVHLAAAGFPIVADALYGDGEGISLADLKPAYKGGRRERSFFTADALPDERPLLGRLGLHAWALSLEHPVTRQPVHFKAPYPKDFRLTLERLRKFSPPARQGTPG
jgi:RluA family pseudouridine synthase